MSLVELDRFADPMLAQIVRGRLEAAGVPAFCFDSGMNAAESAPLMVQVRVMVLPEDLQDARAILAEDADSEGGGEP